MAAALWVEHRAVEAAARGVSWAPAARRLGPFAAVAAADVLNVGLMRRREWSEGIRVRSEATGEEVGTSRVAGALAVAACITGRVGAAAPILTVPPLLLLRMERSSAALAGSAALRTAALMAMVAVSIQVSVPLTFGLFRQSASVPAGWLEERVAAAAGGPDARVVYNKGL